MPTSTPGDQTALIDLAVESWRFSRVFLRMLGKLDAGEKTRFESQHRWYLKRVAECLEAADLRLVNIEEQVFDPGIAAKAINLGDFAPEEALVVEQMLEPIIMGSSGVVRSGTVVLRRAGA